MLAQLQCGAIAHNHAALGIIHAEEVLHHGKCLGRGDHHGVGIGIHKLYDAAGVIRLHVLHHQIIRRPAAQYMGQVVQPFIGKAGIHRVHHGDLLIQNDIGVIRHTVGNNVFTLEKINPVVIDTDIFHIIGNKHSLLPFCFSLL